MHIYINIPKPDGDISLNNIHYNVYIFHKKMFIFWLIFVLPRCARYAMHVCYLMIPWVAAIDRWLADLLKLQDRFPVELRLHLFIPCTRRSGGTAHEFGGCDQSIGSTVSDAIVRSWLWSTATRSSPLCYFSRLLQVVDNWPQHSVVVDSLSTGRVLAMEDFTFNLGSWCVHKHK